VIVMENIEETPKTVANATTGALLEAVETVTDPVARVRRLERKGAPTNRRLAGQAQELARDTAKTARQVLDGTIPERFARGGLRMVKARARRHDPIGNATYRALELVHDGLGSAAKTLGRLEEATAPPARGSAGRSAGASDHAPEHPTTASRRPSRKTAAHPTA
jgi:hypothetical protein